MARDENVGWETYTNRLPSDVEVDGEEDDLETDCTGETANSRDPKSNDANGEILQENDTPEEVLRDDSDSKEMGTAQEEIIKFFDPLFLGPKPTPDQPATA